MILLDSINTFWDPNIMDLLSGIKNSLPSDGLVSTAKEVAAFLALIYLSVRAYAMILGESQFQVMQLLRPFVITLVIINFSTYVSIINTPGASAGGAERAKFEGNVQLVNEQLTLKDNLRADLFKKMIEQTNEIKKIYHTPNDDVGTFNVSGQISEAFADLGASITVYEQLFWAKLSMWFQDLITWIVLSFFKGICYCIFFVELVLLHILMILGPLAFGFSIAGPFSNSWATWTARYIAVSFYTAIGFIILNIGAAIMLYGLTQEVDRLNYVISLSDVQEQFLAVVNHTDNFVGYLLIAIFVVMAGIACVPTISTWIISEAGAGAAFFGTGMSAARGAANAAGGVVGRAAGSMGKIIKK